jgi:hypothetical protein
MEGIGSIPGGHAMGLTTIYDYNVWLIMNDYGALPYVRGVSDPLLSPEAAELLRYYEMVQASLAYAATYSGKPLSTGTGTQTCISKGITSTFSGVSATVGDVTKEVGGHWNFDVTIQVSSIADRDNCDSTYQSVGGFRPLARFGGTGVTLHLKDLGEWAQNDDGTWSTSATAHLDLFNPNDGLIGLVGHGVVDFVGGHVVQFFGGDIDPSSCPF